MGKPLNVLIAGYEAAPFFKHGGLGDVVSSLPKALHEIGVDVRVVIPFYNDIEAQYKEQRIGEFSVVFGSTVEKITIFSGFFPKTKVPIYFLQNKKHLASINLRGRNKKIDQFAFFDLAIVEFAFWLDEKKKWCPTLIHCNDWQTALVPLLMQKRIPTLLTIHNLSYQGFGSRKVLDLLHIKDEETKQIKRKTPVKEIDILGEGILHATKVSTVSPNYAAEIMRNENHYKHDIIYAYLRRREQLLGHDGIIGILNGIDYDVWDPSKDNVILKNYDVSSWMTGKKEIKEDILKFFSLPPRPTFCFIGRMATQKGIDVLIKAIHKIVNLNVNLIFLGSGEPNIERSVKRVVQKYSDNIRAEIVYSEEISHKLYAGCDFIIIPSHFEPCGLIQMIAMRYGTLPIASETGGLKDSIIHGKNGFLFKKDSSRALFEAVKKALDVYNNNTAKFKTMVEMAMHTDFSWKKSAVLYKKLYEDIIRS